MTIDGETIIDRGEIWSVRQVSSDGEPSELAFPEGEVEARRHQHAFGGMLWVRQMFVTEGHEAEQVTDAELMDML